MPKTNNYRSLHSTVIGPGGERIEIQIRTREMHLVAERGIAAHWRYKERGQITETTAEQFEWMKDLVSWHQTVGNSEEFLDTLKSDLFDTEIYVFTPKGDVKELPEGSSPIDFAYGIHTHVGNSCVGARVNGRIVPIKYQLQNGDTVEILTSKNQTPSKDWLNYCVTTKAKSKIRWFVKEEQRRRSLILGKELVEKEFRKYGASLSRFLKAEELEKFLKELGLTDLDEYCIRVGYGKIEPKHLVEKLIQSSAPVEPEKPESQSIMQKIVKAASQKSKKSGSLVTVDGMEDVLVHYARCCYPIPGDAIMGFITRGRGITVHRADCRKAFEQDQLKRVEVVWTAKNSQEEQVRIVRLRVLSQDTPGLLKLMSEAFAVHGVNIQNAQIRTTKDKKAVSIFDVSVKNISQLNLSIFELQKIKGIIGVSRLKG
jgi:GTP pyrophosphokinase